MNSYTSEHAAYRIIGAPPSFVGYGDVSPILKFVKDNDCGVILLDEMEKAHPVVIDFFIEIFDTGKFTDAAGRSYSFNRFCFILTSNLSFDFGPMKNKQVGFGAQEEQPRGDLKEIIRKLGVFKQSFMGRVRLVEFTHLPERSLRDIARKLLTKMVDHMYNIGFDIREATRDESIIDEIVDRYSQDRGARSMREFVDGVLKHRLIEQYQKLRLQDGYKKTGK
jgi:ATP-dependent Clp protease ATP-binding subunit ClpA